MAWGQPRNHFHHSPFTPLNAGLRPNSSLVIRARPLAAGEGGAGPAAGALLLQWGIADHFPSGLAEVATRMGKLLSREGSRAGSRPLVFSPSTHPQPHRLKTHKSLCMRPCSPGTFSSRGERVARALSAREPLAFASSAFSGPPAPSSRTLLSEPQPALPAPAVWVFIDLSSDPLTGSQTPAP